MENFLGGRNEKRVGETGRLNSEFNLSLLSTASLPVTHF
jgi:hypothetical protein